MPSLRRWIIAALLAALGLLGGCSALRLAYNQGPEIAYWWLDGYADFDVLQKPRVRQAIGDWFAWHRRTQLPDYAALLVRAEADVAGDVKPEEVCRLASDVRERLVLAFEPAVPALAAIAPTLSDEQLQHIERRFAKVNDDFRDDYLQDSAEERQRAAVKRTVERTEMLYGPLERAQRERIVRGIAGSPFDPDVWLAERKARQADILATLRWLSTDKPAPDEARAALRALGQRIATSPHAAYRSYEKTLTLYNCQLAADVHNLSTPAQRHTAAKRLKGYENDVRALIAQDAR
jgi:hypothetical protein